MAGASVLRIIIGEFSHRQEPSPVVLLIIDEDAKVGLHNTILPFSLAIGLRVEGS